MGLQSSAMNFMQVLVDVITDRNAADCGIGTKKRSVDYSVARQKRQSSVTFPNVMINQDTVTMISDTLLPNVMNVSLDGGQ